MASQRRSSTTRFAGVVGALSAVSGLIAGCGVIDLPGSEEAATTTTAAIQSDAQIDAATADGDTESVAETADPAADLPTATVGLVLLAPAPTMVLTAAGFNDSVEDCDVVDIEVVERNADGQLPALTPITEALLSRGVDMIATVTTPAAMTAHDVVGQRGGTTPVVYATVTDPFSAGLADDPRTHDPWITGSASPPPFEAVMDAAQAIVPGLSVVGVMGNPEEANSRFAVEGIQRVSQERGLSVEFVEVAETTEVGDAARTLIDRGIEAFIIPTDTTVFTGLPTVSEIAAESDIPVIGTDPNQANSGAAIALGSDYYGSGFRAGGIACRVLGGEATPADFDVVDIESLGVTINEEAAEAQNVTIPAELREIAEFSQ